MKILTLNCGSSSIKCFLYDFEITPSQPAVALWEARLEWKNNFENPCLTIHNIKGKTHHEEMELKTKNEALKYLITFLFQGDTAVIKSLEELSVIGHRIVHGGSRFHESVLITKEVKNQILLYSSLSALYNLAQLEGIQILDELCKNSPQIAVFDTSFHHTLSKEAQTYPGPYKWLEEGIKRYGFHGISFQYCSKRGAAILDKDIKSLKMVICHLGSGASLCAVKEGISIDTTMGFTPLDGLMMDTRSGSIDPGILLYLLEKKKSLQELSLELYKESGLLGISGISSDMRDVIKESLNGHSRAILALDIYIHRLTGLIGSMIAALEGIDVLIFTAGIGENVPLLRERVCHSFSFLGLQLDIEKNEQGSLKDIELSLEDSKIKVLLIHTQEAFEIASECFKKISIS